MAANDHRHGSLIFPRALAREIQRTEGADAFTLFWRLHCDASWEDSVIATAYGTVTLRRGQCVASSRHYEAELGISRGTIRRCFERWEKRGWISTGPLAAHLPAHQAARDAAHSPLVVTLLNYDTYTELSKRTGPRTGPRSERAPSESGPIDKEKSFVDERKSPLYPPADAGGNGQRQFRRTRSRSLPTSPERTAEEEAEQRRNDYLGAQSIVKSWIEKHGVPQTEAERNRFKVETRIPWNVWTDLQREQGSDAGRVH